MRDRELEAVTALSAQLVRAHREIDVAKPLVRQVVELLGVGFASVTLVDESGDTARGLYGERNGEPFEWWSSVTVDLRNEPSGIASAVFDAAPVTVYDVAGSPLVNKSLANRVGAKSGTFVPMIAEDPRDRRADGGIDRRAAGIQPRRAGTAAGGRRRGRARARASLLGFRPRRGARPRADRRCDRTPAPCGARACGRRGRRRVGAPRRARPRPLRGRPRRRRARRYPGRGGGRARRHARRAAWNAARSRRGAAAGGGRARARLGAADRTSARRERASARAAAGAAPCVAGRDRRALARGGAAAARGAGHVALARGSRGLLPDRPRARHAPLRRRARVRLVARRVRVRPARAAGRRAAQPGGARARAGAGAGCADPEPRLRGVLPLARRPDDVVGGDARRASGSACATAEGVRERRRRAARGVRLARGAGARNAESFEASIRQARVQRGFYRIAALLGEPLSLAETYDATAHAAAEALGGDFAAVSRAARRGPRARGRLRRAGRAARICSLPPALADAAAGGNLLAAAQVAGDERFGACVAGSARFASLLGIPVSGDAAGGLVLVCFRERARVHAGRPRARAAGRGRRARSARPQPSLRGRARRPRAVPATRARRRAARHASSIRSAVLQAAAREALQLLAADCGVAFAARRRRARRHGSRGQRGAEQRWAVALRRRLGRPATCSQSRAPVAHARLDLGRGLADLGAAASATARTSAMPLAGGGRAGALVYSTEPRRWREDEIEALVDARGERGGRAVERRAVPATSRSSASRAARSSRTSPTASSPSTATAASSSGTAPRRRSPACRRSEAVGRTTAEVLQRDLESGRGGTTRLVAIPRGGGEVWLVALGGGHARPGRHRRRPHLRVPRHLGRARGRADEVGLRLDRLARAASAADLDLRVRADPAPRRRRFRRRRTPHVPRVHRSGGRAADRRSSTRSSTSPASTPATSRCRSSPPTSSPSSTRWSRRPRRLRTAIGSSPTSRRSYRPRRPTRSSCATCSTSSSGTPSSSRREAGRSRSRRTARDDTVELAVTDEGVGIPPSERERIFAKFAKARRGESRGTGVGLFIAQGLVREMGGRIRVRLGRGTGFTIRVRASACDAV